MQDASREIAGCKMRSESLGQVRMRVSVAFTGLLPQPMGLVTIYTNHAVLLTTVEVYRTHPRNNASRTLTTSPSALRTLSVHNVRMCDGTNNTNCASNVRALHLITTLGDCSAFYCESIIVNVDIGVELGDMVGGTPGKKKAGYTSVGTRQHALCARSCVRPKPTGKASPRWHSLLHRNSTSPINTQAPFCLSTSSALFDDMSPF
jgi:hypothetical protein